MSKHTHSKESEDRKKAEEAAGLRGEAKAATAVGVLGGAGWLATEMLPALDVMGSAADAAWLIGDSSAKKTARNMAVAAGVVAIGALGIAAYKHSRAHEIDASRKTIPVDDDKAKSWAERVQRPDSEPSREL